MSFEDIPYSNGDTVVVPGMAQITGQIVDIHKLEHSEPLCVIRVGFTNPNVEQEYVFEDGDPWDMHFSLEV